MPLEPRDHSVRVLGLLGHLRRHPDFDDPLGRFGRVGQQVRGPRSGRDFGERERFLLALLRPHIAEAHRAAVRRHAGQPPLTPRQLELLELVREGCTNRQIGRRLGVSEGTVRTHLNNIFERLEVTSRTAAVTRGLAHVG